MTIIDCQEIKDRIMKDITPLQFKGKGLLIIMKENTAANRSYAKSIEKMAQRYGLPVEVRCPDPQHPVDDIRCILRIRPKGTGVLFMGYARDEVVDLHHWCHKELKGKRIADSDKHPDVVRAVLEVLQTFGLYSFLPPERTAIIGRSRNARSLCSALLEAGHTPTIIHRQTVGTESILRDADVIVSFAGSPNLITGDEVKDGAVIISVGCGTQNGKLCGDIDMESMAERDVYVTPTPGGIGPICTAVLLRDLARWEVWAR